MFTKAGIDKSPIFNNIQVFRESLRTCAGLQLLEVLHRRRLIRKQVEARGRIFGELNLAIREPVVEPLGGDTEMPGELRDRQIPGHLARMRLMPLLHEAMLEPNSSDRAR